MLKRHHIALILVVLIVLVLLNLPSGLASKFKLAAGSLFLPLFGLAGSSRQLTETASDMLVPRRVLAEENRRLRLENEQCRLLQNETAEIRRENLRLRELLGWQAGQPARYKAARIIARDPSGWWRTAQIDAGSRDGIQAHLPVRTAEGLVGRVVSVGATRSQILLIGDPNLRVGALIQESRETGVLFSGDSSPLEHNMADLGFLSRGSAVKPGQTVVTSGMGGIFPKGIPIGQIVDFEPADMGLSIKARVRLFARMNALEEVWVMLP